MFSPGPSLISVILPVYNGVTTIARAVASIQAQHDSRWELIVLDDGSTDGTTTEARRFAREDSRIRVVERCHRGLVPALQEACTLAQGTYLARMDVDDVSLPQRLSEQRAWFADHPGGGLCGTHVSMAGDGLRDGRRRYERWLNEIGTHETIERELFIECPVAHPTFMMSRVAYDNVGGYRDFDGPEDYDLIFRFWQRDYTLGNVGTALLEWHDSPNRLSMNSPRYAEEAFRRLKRHWLKATGVGEGCPLFQWGAGEVGKRWLREWAPGTIEAVVDIRPGKIGQRIHGTTVIPPEELPRPGECYFLIAVGTPGARGIIRDWCHDRGYHECDDYRFIA